MGARENILNRLKEAEVKRGPVELSEPDWDSSIYHEQGKNLADNFQTNLELIGGNLIRCENLENAISRLKELLGELNIQKPFCLDPKLKKAMKDQVGFTSSSKDFESMQAGITPCEFLVAHLGSVLVSSAGASGRRLHVFPETHIIIAHQKQLVNFLEDGMDQLQKKYKDKLPSAVTNITGPSRTADIEKTLVMGMHGPRKLFVFLCDEPF